MAPDRIRTPQIKITQNHSFAEDVLAGLQSEQKSLPSKYFYDEKGDALFQQIMKLKEYYLTDCEYQILETNADKLLQQFTDGNKSFSLIELGAGDGFKTKVLLRHFLKQKADFTYVPIDISENAVQKLSSSLRAEFPELQIKPLVMDFFQGLEFLVKQENSRKVVLFLGSSIGNFPHVQAEELLAQINKRLSADDFLLTGFDLKKEPGTILAAYNDPKGVTREFNLNLLERINRETGANFNLTAFLHMPLYDPMEGEARSYLVSTKAQQIYFPDQNIIIDFAAWEAVHTEISRKYSVAQTNRIADGSGFRPVEYYTDQKGWFLDALWQKI